MGVERAGALYLPGRIGIPPPAAAAPERCRKCARPSRLRRRLRDTKISTGTGVSKGQKFAEA